LSLIPAPFDYIAAETAGETVSLLAQHGDDAKVLAGGQSLIPLMKLRLATPRILVDIGRLSTLRAVEDQSPYLTIGAMVTESDIEWSPVILAHCPVLVDGSRVIADPLVRELATVGGNVAHGDPANDHPAIMVALEADFQIMSQKGERTVRAEDFFIDLFTTALQSTDLLTTIRVPVQRPGTGAAYVKFERQVGDYAIAGTAASVQLQDGLIGETRIALTNLGPIPVRAKEAENSLNGEEPSESQIGIAAELAASACEPSDDLRGPPDYRRRVASWTTRHALGRAIARAQGGHSV
jgi:carbon-monoxide dehydrogenase medium subunit